MHHNVLFALCAMAGLPVSAIGAGPLGTFEFEVRVVRDGDVEAPSGSGITSYAPGPFATRIGLTLQARVTQTASGTLTGSGNYGIGGVLTASSTGPARFNHDDLDQSGGSYLALGRGQTGNALGSDGLPQAGFFGGENNPVDLLGGTAGRTFRSNLTGGGSATISDVNSLNGNAPVGNGSFSSKANGAFADSAAGIHFMAGVIPLITPSDSTLYAVGVTSPWYNLYRVYFDPRPGTLNVARSVTVTFTGRVAAVGRSNPGPLGDRILGIGSYGALIETSASATFYVGAAVPAPSATVVMGIAGLLAARRRRAIY